MRSDAIGLWWQDLPTTGKRSQVQRVMPPIPDTGWVTPTEFPNLRNARILSLDTETKEPEFDRGPGWARGVGHIVGMSIGTDDGASWYFPMRHEVEPEHNMDPDHVLAWARDTLSDPRQPKVGANLLYDLGWLEWEGVKVRGPLADVQFAEALLDERAKVALDTLGEKYLGEGKEDSLLYKWCADYYGGKRNDSQRANIWRAPPRLVGPYAQSDATLPIRIMPAQALLLEREGMMQLFRMECELIPLLIAMRMRGVRVDIPAAERVRDQLLREGTMMQKQLDTLAGQEINVDSPECMARLFEKLGLRPGVTPGGKPSFAAPVLDAIDHPAVDLVKGIRKLDKLRGTFIESYILGSHVNGRVYCQFHPLRGESKGTRSGRFSSSNPNLQNVPSRDEELAPLVRGIFVPDEGHKQWRKYDYSQIEYRMLIHYAVGRHGDSVRRHFNEHPDLDYHDYAHDLIHRMVGIDLPRKPIKTINFGLIYGMGKASLIRRLKLSKSQGNDLFAAYHKSLPFANETLEATMGEADRLGYITTILGRRSRFDLFEPREGEGPALPYRAALAKYGHVKRAYLHKALNRRLQGSAADLMKRAMWVCWKDGIFDATGVPSLTVHDELDFSDPGGRDEAFAEMKRVMEQALPLRVPVRADYDAGPDWGHCEAPA